MKSHFPGNYSTTLALLAGVCCGAAVGVLWPDAALFVKPAGDIFLNLLFALVAPMVFFSISLAFLRLKARGRVGAILLRTLLSLAVIWLVCCSLSYVCTVLVNPLGDASALAVPDAASTPDASSSVPKFHLLPLIVLSALTGLGTAAAGSRGKAFAEFLESADAVVMKTMDMLMKAAPVGLSCYFAPMVASVGGVLIGGYLRVLVMYCILAAVLLFLVIPLSILLLRGRSGLKSFLSGILPPSLAALSTASSSIAMPLNIDAARGMGIDADVAQSVVPLATNLLKAGSAALDVMKIVFLMTLCGMDVAGAGNAFLIIGLAVLSALVSGAVTNGGVTGELLICTMLGIDPAMAGMIMIIGTMADIPATLVNSQSTVVAAVLADSGNRRDES